ncbi:hypothetical protein ACFSKW_12030 [Nonomuraea mangrovi]|uniref:Uncharacterized protein n=1 Tax=Nonomuraea mangrovi TaxID=2316207 RepID=A0ABW4SUD2_9ACTN
MSPSALAASKVSPHPPEPLVRAAEPPRDLDERGDVFDLARRVVGLRIAAGPAAAPSKLITVKSLANASATPATPV